MADDPKLPEKPQAATPQPQTAPSPAPQPTPPVVEREPLTVTVTPPAPVEVRPRVQVEVPPSITVWRSSMVWLLIIGAALLVVFYRLQLSPLVQRFEHGLQRRVLGEREYDAHRDPHSRFDQLPRAHEDAAHR